LVKGLTSDTPIAGLPKIVVNEKKCDFADPVDSRDALLKRAPTCATPVAQERIPTAIVIDENTLFF
jgi:hypothetical protein